MVTGREGKRERRKEKKGEGRRNKISPLKAQPQ
jgi:hypothetical protein